VLEESRTTKIAGNKAIIAVPAHDGLTIIIIDSVKGYARAVPNGINNKGWLSWIPDWSQIENQQICHHLNPFLPVLVLQQ
jgi:hypothetical protein